MSAAAAAPADATHHSDPKTARLSTALQTTRRNAAYLLDPKANPGPGRRHVRFFLRSLRYIAIFAFWRLVRYAKYAAVGAITAAVAGTAIGTLTGGIGFVLAPPGIFAGAGVGLVWGIAKFGWRTAVGRVRRGETGADARRDESGEAHEEKYPAERVEMKVDPW
ncbi:hypothetical protein K461DRAFT_293047 [Myriangium duriaei CBS 260.36]|uniref:Uncharacterized protein n=1 Tax=Myriangium duriaei CBS 260.36 TaxID=1168546 RepID=A0A9P4J6K8_9PEZI|nr:hypothetical protein K461DRAFT_293047 [Myriangium duriaei CBS 260.36]